MRKTGVFQNLLSIFLILVGFLVFNGLSISLVAAQVCPDGEFNDGTGTCLACDSPCLTCSDAGNGNCITCVSGYFPDNNGFCLIDDTPPVIQLTYNTNWSNTQPEVLIVVSDDLSGVAGIRYDFGTFDDSSSPDALNPFLPNNGGDLTTCQDATNIYIVGETIIDVPMGDTIIFFCAYDYAGNFSATQGLFRWEDVPPTIQINNSSNTWFSVQPLASANIFDTGGSGLSANGVRFFTNTTPDTNPFEKENDDCSAVGAPYESGVEINTDIGGITVWWCARDNAGNIAFGSGPYRFDSTPPHASISFTSAESITTSNPATAPNYDLLISDDFDTQVTINLDGTQNYTFNTTNFDPFWDNLDVAGAADQVSGVVSCLLEVRSVPILTDGSGQLATRPEGSAVVIDWSEFEPASTSCDQITNFMPQPNTAYHFRYSAIDYAGNASDIYISSTLIYNTSPIYVGHFNSLDDENQIVILDCTDTLPGDVCAQSANVPATLGAAEGNFETCLNIEGMLSPVCNNISANSSSSTPYVFTIDVANFPLTRDTFIGGTLTTTSPTDNTVVRNINVVITIRRNIPEPAPPFVRQNYVRMFNPRLND